MSDRWDAGLYESSHSFVWQHGRELLGLLGPQPGERILDVGCGTGQLTAEIAAAGAQVVGIDNSPAMIGQARQNFPQLRFEVQDVGALSYDAEFDAVFSNAALHWVRDAEAAAGAMASSLKPGGRFVAELGGRGNIRELLKAAYRALRSLNVPEPERLNPWYFPGIGEYATVLERHGLEVSSAVLFDRFTPLEGGASGLANWCAMFAGHLTQALPPPAQEEFLRLTERFAADRLFRDGLWFVDYRRLRIAARREPER